MLLNFPRFPPRGPGPERVVCQMDAARRPGHSLINSWVTRILELQLAAVVFWSLPPRASVALWLMWNFSGPWTLSLSTHRLFPR